MGVGVFLGASFVVMSYLAAYIWILLLIAAIFMMKRAYSNQVQTAPEIPSPVLPPERPDQDFGQQPERVPIEQ